MVAWHASRAPPSLVPGWQCRCSGEEQRNDKLFGEIGHRSAVRSGWQMHQAHIKERQQPENAVGQEQRMRHLRDDNRESQRHRYCGSQEPLAMTIMETMPFLQREWRQEPRVQQPVCHVKEPGAESKCAWEPWRQLQPGGAPKSPAPEGSYSGCIQTQKMPVPQQYVRQTNQILV
jgi:hypothetical protein